MTLADWISRGGVVLLFAGFAVQLSGLHVS
jgi:hypothetical protein